MEYTNLIDQIAPGWSEKSIEGTKFNETFALAGIPLWWFYSRFVLSHVLPKQFKLDKQIKQPVQSFGGKLYYSGLSLTFRKIFYHNERRKQLSRRGYKEEANKDKVLILTYTNHLDSQGNIYRVQSIIDKFQNDGKIEPLVLFTDPISKRTDLEKFENTVYDYVNDKNKLLASGTARSLQAKWEKINKQELFGNHWGSIRYTMNFFFSYEFIYNTTLYFHTMKDLLQRQRIKAVVLTSRNGFFEKCLMAAAEKLLIPVVIVQHGLGLGVVDQETFPGIKFAVFGELYRQRLLRRGVRDEDITITGPIIFDEIKKQEISQKVGKVVIITAPFVEDSWLSEEDYVRSLKKIMKCIKGREIVVKMHPREKNKALYENILKEETEFSISNKVGSRHLYELLRDAELVINFFSTVALEAMIMDKKVLTIDMGPAIVPDIKETPYEGGVMVKIDQDIAAAVKKTIEDKEWTEKRREVVSRFCYKVDGKAAERTVEMMYQLIAKKI